jgi:hypothetical protein
MRVDLFKCQGQTDRATRRLSIPLPLQQIHPSKHQKKAKLLPSRNRSLPKGRRCLELTLKP